MMLPSPRIVLLLATLTVAAIARAQGGLVEQLAPDVYFRTGDHGRGHCNNGWIVFDDFVLVVDANYPAGAQELLPLIRAVTTKPVRYVVDTHFHPDHAFGNKIWADTGAIIVAHRGVLEGLKQNGAAVWALEAKTHADVAASALVLPSLVYSDTLVFEDGHHRVELRWPGIAHTPGDSLVWLPREKILFTGDLCVNGAYNYVHDSDVSHWIDVLASAQALGAAQVCPGHGARGGPELLAGQRNYFAALQRQVQSLLNAKKSPAEIRAAIPTIETSLRADAGTAWYTPTDPWFAAHVEKIYQELAGKVLPK